MFNADYHRLASDLLQLQQEVQCPLISSCVQSKFPWGVLDRDWPAVWVLEGETGPDWQTHSLAPTMDNLRVLPWQMSHGH